MRLLHLVKEKNRVKGKLRIKNDDAYVKLVVNVKTK